MIDKELFDPVLTAQLANGFSLKGLIPDYFPSDTASRGYATFLEWLNLDYRPGAKRRYHNPVEPIRLAVVQYQMRAIKGFDELATQCEFFIDVASDYKSDFVVFPELFTTQLLSCVPKTRPGQAARQLSEFTPQYLEFFTEMAVKYDVNVIGGSHFVVEEGVLYNISYLFRRDGTLGKQYKIHITPSEKKWWGVSPGEKVEVFETDCGTIAILVCYDIEFPELVRIAAQKGAGSFSYLSIPTRGTATYASAIVPLPVAWKTTCTWRSRVARETCRLSRIPISTTHSRPSSRLPTRNSPAMPSAPSVVPTSKR